MIISRTPFRISFAGGGSDLKEYYSNFGGCVLSATIKKYIYLSIHPYFYNHKYFLKYSKTENVDHIDQIEHRIIKAVFSDYQIQGVDFNSSADIPAGTGLGSSSAFTAGLITLCNAFTGKYMSKENIADYASKIEIERLGEPIGKQDQYACAIGGLNFISFNQDDSVTVEHLFLKKENLRQLQQRLLAFYTGTTRSASSILASQKNNMLVRKDKIEHISKMVKLATDLHHDLSAGSIDTFGEIMHAGWAYKKEVADGISNQGIDDLYAAAINSGASGGKLLGAGGGGFLLFYVKEESQNSVRQALRDLHEIPIEFDTIGSTIIYYD
jgi:D-glycero-alpha-D-manno-heptose-7-phosphate kinase